jgi:hypothetical protein
MAEAEQSTPKFRHISDIDVWLTPDRNYFVFILLSVFCGFFALDHFYLRSFDTAFQKLIYNFFGLGIWYWWDVVQIFTEGKRVQDEGLSSPFDWIQGIGRGVFVAPGTETKYAPQKSYIIWAFLAMFGGFFALDKFYLGDYLHAFSKLISIFSPIFLFGLLWVAWDAFHAFFMTKETISGKISLPIPLTWFGFNETDGSIFLPGKEKQSGGISAIAQAIAGAPLKQWINLGTLMGLPQLASATKGLTGKLQTLQTKASDVASSVPSLPVPEINTEAVKSLKPETTNP